MAHGMEIGAGPGVLRRSGRADPPDRSAARIVLADARLGAVAMAQAANFESAGFLQARSGTLTFKIVSAGSGSVISRAVISTAARAALS